MAGMPMGSAAASRGPDSELPDVPRVTPTTDARAARQVDLFRHAAERLLAGSGRLGGPLCVVIPGGRAAILDDLAGRAEAAGREVISRDGAALGREIAAALADDSWGRLRAGFSTAELVVVQRLDAVGGAERQAAVRQLFDAAPGPAWCVAVGRHPEAGPLAADLAARIASGLTITLPEAGPRDDGSPGAGPPAAESSSRPPTLARIVAATARHFGLAAVDLVGPGRGRSVVRARSLAMYLARRLTPSSYASIGRALGGRDHTTAMHGARITATRLALDRGLAEDVAVISAGICGGRRTRRPAGSVSDS